MFEEITKIIVVQEDEQEFTDVFEGLAEEENEIRGTGNYSDFDWEFVGEEG